MPKPKDTNEMSDRLRPYLKELTAWLERRQKEIEAVKKGGPEGTDPPPRPPDLGP